MSNLVPCKSCETPVAPTAKVCPNCGVKNPGVTNKEMVGGCLVVIVLVFIFGGLLSMCSGDNTANAPDKHEINEREYSEYLERPLRDWRNLSAQKRVKYSRIFAFSLLKEEERADQDVVIFWGSKLNKCLDTAVSENNSSVDFKIQESAAICWQLMKEN